MANLEVAKQQQVAARAHETERVIVEARAANIQNQWVAARALHAFVEDRMWEPLGYDTLEAWIASPGIELKRTEVFRLVRVYRELVVQRQVPLAELEGVHTTKADVVLAAVKDGRVDVAEALSDCRTLVRRDLQVRYAKADPNSPDDPSDEPARVRCEHCGGWYTPKGSDS